MPVSESVIKERIARVNEFTPAEAAWLAAAIDGEGYIRMDHPNPKNPEIIRPRIGISNTSREFIENAQKIIGNAGSFRLRPRAHEGYKDQYTLEVNGWVVVPVLNQILEHLIIKKNQAIKILIEMDLKRGI